MGKIKKLAVLIIAITISFVIINFIVIIFIQQSNFGFSRYGCSVEKDKLLENGKRISFNMEMSKIKNILNEDSWGNEYSIEKSELSIKIISPGPNEKISEFNPGFRGCNLDKKCKSQYDDITMNIIVINNNKNHISVHGDINGCYYKNSYYTLGYLIYDWFLLIIS